MQRTLFNFHFRMSTFMWIAIAVLTTNIAHAQESVVRDWNEAMLNAIRNDLARPNVHARNLYHFTEGIYHLQLST